MHLFNLKDMVRGWFIGNFDKKALSADVELAVKKYKAGEKEAKHHHKIGIEVTTVVSGEIMMNKIKYVENDIIVIYPEESVEFESLTDSITVVFKSVSVVNDKYLD